jgi:lipopolysaccharide heptosyltransferase II
MKMDLSRVLIIQTAFIGDVILATPLIESLKGFDPGMEVDFLLRKGNEGLFEGHPKVSQVLVWDKSNKFSSLFKTIREIRKSKYDLVLNLQRFFSTGLITFLSGSQRNMGFTQNPFSFFYDQKFPFSTKKMQHEVDRNLELLSSFPEILLKRAPRIYPSDQHKARAIELTKGERFISISPASIWFTKQVPEDVWKGLLEVLPDDLKVIFLGGIQDWVIAERISRGFEDKSVNLCGKTSFLESAAILELSLLNYSNDSAPLHLSSSVNAPSVAVYCSTLPEFGFGPLSTFSRIFEVPDLNCRPCGLHGRKKCPQDHFNCGKAHDPRLLLKAYEDVISFGEKERK